MTAPAPPCPGCGMAVALNPRYPDRFCDACLKDRATDHAGIRLAFVEDMRSAVGWRREGETGWTPAAAVLCLIAGHPAVVHEARFGGLVALPAGDSALPRHPFATDLTRPT